MRGRTEAGPGLRTPIRTGLAQADQAETTVDRQHQLAHQHRLNRSSQLRTTSDRPAATTWAVADPISLIGWPEVMSLFGPGTFGSPGGINLGPSPTIGTNSSPLPPLDQERSPPPTPNPNDRVNQAEASGSSSQTQAQVQLALSAAARIRAISPPTPAPSPQPFGNRLRFLSTGHATQDWSRNLTDTVRPDEDIMIGALRAQFGSLSSAGQLALLTALVADSPPSTLSPLLPLITPRLKRDFLRTLPLELSFHVLTFVDDVRTLARASGVSHFWRALLEDEGTWKRMCWKSGFGDAAEGTKQRQIGERMRQMEFGERMEEEGTPAGRERRGTLDRIRLAELAANLEIADSNSSDPSTRGSGWQAATIQSDATQTGASTWENSTGLGLGSSFAVDPVATNSSLAQRRLRNSTRASSNPPITADISLLTSPPRPLPFTQTRMTGYDESTVSPTTQIPDPISTTTLDQSPSQSSTSNSTAGLGIPDSSDRTPTLESASPTRPGPARLFNLGSAQASSSVPLRSPSYSNPIPTYPEPVPEPKPFSYKTHFKRAYLTESAWLRGPGRLLSTQMSTDDGVVTSLGFDNEWIVVGMATSKVHVFEAETGSYVKTLDGHELGVWCLTLVSSGGGSGSGNSEHPPTSPTRSRTQPGVGLGPAPGRAATNDRSFTTNSPAARSNTNLFRSSRGEDSSATADSSSGQSRPKRRRSFHAFEAADAHRHDSSSGPRTGGMGLGAGGETGDSTQQAGVCGTARGWGQKGAVVVSGGCDRDVRVWDLKSGACKHVLRGHTSTVRCMRVIDGRPIAVSGSRDATLRVWNIETGQSMHLLSGHEHSVRCIEVSGNKVVSGSYDATCRVSSTHNSFNTESSR